MTPLSATVVTEFIRGLSFRTILGEFFYFKEVRFEVDAIERHRL
jgi:hypothetical protein